MSTYLPLFVLSTHGHLLLASGYFTFSRASDITSSDLILTFERRGVGNGVVFDNDTLAYAYAPQMGGFFYNVDVNWSVTPESNAFDLETVALHEIGHLLGLAHSQDENAIMWAYIPIGEAKGLNQDDIQGVKVLYGIIN
ncbi:putative stromelysin 2 [Helianthus debilis subsp. tardiflorus]